MLTPDALKRIALGWHLVTWGVCLLHQQQIIDWLIERYGASFAVATCQLFRSYTNDVYLIHRADQTFVLKLYGLGWRSPAEVQWELDLLRHVSSHGVPVAEPIAGRNRTPLQTLATPAGQRSAVLFAYAPGGKPQPPFSTALYTQFGQAIGRLHDVADSFVATQPRQALTTAVLIDEPVRLVAALLRSASERTWLVALASMVKERILRYAIAGLDWGVIHGDATLDNLHVTQEGAIILYDFDSAALGWRAADLQGWAIDHVEYQAQWDAFLQGYERVRSPGANDCLAAPYLTLAVDIWGLKVDLERRIIAEGPEQVQAYLGRKLALLRSRGAQYGVIVAA